MGSCIYEIFDLLTQPRLTKKYYQRLYEVGDVHQLCPPTTVAIACVNRSSDPKLKISLNYLAYVGES